MSVSDVESRVSEFLLKVAVDDLRYDCERDGEHEVYSLDRADLALLLEDHRMLAAIRDRVEEWGAVPWRAKDEDDHIAVVERVLEIVRERGAAL